MPTDYMFYILQNTVVTNSVNIGTVALNKRAKARSIGSSEYKNLKLKKKEEKKRAEDS